VRGLKLLWIYKASPHPKLNIRLLDNVKNLKRSSGSSYFSLFPTSLKVLRIIKYFSAPVTSKLPIVRLFHIISQVNNSISSSALPSLSPQGIKCSLFSKEVQFVCWWSLPSGLDIWKQSILNISGSFESFYLHLLNNMK